MNRTLLTNLFFLASLMCSMAQSDSITDVKTGYNVGFLPAISYNSDLGFQYGVVTNLYNYGNGTHYPNYEHSLFAEVSHYTKGSGIFRLFYDSKFLIPGIRLTADLAYLPDQALGFYGFNGYDAIYNKDLEDNSSSDYISRMYYRHERNTFKFKVDFQGKLKNSLNWSAGYNFYNIDIASVPINKLNEGKTENLLPNVPLLYDQYVSWGVIKTNEANGGAHHNFQAGLVFDTRDNEACPMSGIWTELVSSNSFGKHFNYGKISFIHRQYFTLIPKDLSLAYRVGYLGKSWGEMPFYLAPHMIYSFNKAANNDGFGGSQNIRGMVRNRLVAESIAYANVELRWKVAYFKFLNQNWYAALSPFMDFGQTIKKIEMDKSGVPLAELDTHFAEGEESLHATYGMGLHLAMNHNFIIAADAGAPLNEQDGKLGVYIGLNWLF